MCIRDEDCDGGEVPHFCSLVIGTCVPSTQRGDICFSFDICGQDGGTDALLCQTGRCRVTGTPTLGLEANANVPGLYCKSNRDCEIDEYCDVVDGGVCRIFNPADKNKKACPTINDLKVLEVMRQNITEVSDVYYNLQGACPDKELCDFAEGECRLRCRLPEKPYSAALVAACRPAEMCDPQCPAGQLCASFEKIFSYSKLDIDPILSIDRDWKRASNPEDIPIKMGLCIDASRIRMASVNGDDDDGPRKLKMNRTEASPDEEIIPEDTPAPVVEAPPPSHVEASEPVVDAVNPNEEKDNTKLLYISVGAGLGAIFILTLFIYLIIWSRKRSANSRKSENPGHVIPPSSPVYSSAPASAPGASKDKKGGAGLFSANNEEDVPAYVAPPQGTSYMPDYKKPL